MKGEGQGDEENVCADERFTAYPSLLRWPEDTSAPAIGQGKASNEARRIDCVASFGRIGIPEFCAAALGWYGQAVGANRPQVLVSPSKEA